MSIPLIGAQPEQPELFEAQPTPGEQTFWHSPSIDQVAGALALAQLDIKPAIKDATNPHFRSKYADLASIWEACREHLASNGIAVVQAPAASDSAVAMVTMLVHKSGQFIASRLVMIARDSLPQSIGSCITYARRYALASMAGVAPDEDDDGNRASGRGDQQQQRPVSQPRSSGPKPHETRTSRPIPDALKDQIETMRQKPTAFAEACRWMENDLFEIAGDAGKALYVEKTSKFKTKYPKGVQYPMADCEDLLIDLWEGRERLMNEQLPM